MRRTIETIGAYLVAGAALAGASCSPHPPDCDPVVSKALKSLSIRDPRVLTSVFLLPESLDADETETERQDLARLLAFLLDEFGTISVGAEVDDAVSFYELSIGGGTQPYWWRKQYSKDSDLVMSAHFSKVGEGVLKVTLVQAVGECLVGEIGLGVPADLPGASEQIRDIRDAFYDFTGVPSDHPLRNSEVTIRQAE